MTQPLGLSFNDSVKQAVYEVLSDPLSFPDVFKGWVTGWIEANPPTLPISQITGFTQFSPQVAPAVANSELTSSTTYVDLTHPGPTLSQLPDGNYLLLFGASGQVATNPDIGYMSPSINAATPSDNNAAVCTSGFVAGFTNACTVAASGGGNNTIKMQYRGNNGNSTLFRNRWLVALKYSNL